MIRNLTDDEYTGLRPTGMRLHTGSAVLPAPKPVRRGVALDESPLCYEHHRGVADYWPLIEEKS